MPAPTADDLHAWLEQRRDGLVGELAEWVRIPSVAGPPEHEVDLLRSANWLAGTLRAGGFPTVEIWPAGNNPTVWAEWPAAPDVVDAPTVLVYSHHDVRTTKDELWEQCPPFEPVVRDGRLYGRGASDAKGQVLAHVWGLRALLAGAGGPPPVNLKLIVDGEEEIGSPNLAELLDRHGDRLAADLIVLSDTMTWSAEQPAVCTGVRGRVQAELEIRGPHHDVHAGAVSGSAPNPGAVLARILAGLHDADGRVAVPGFYDDVREAPEDELEALRQLTADEDAWLARMHTRAVVGERDRSLGERLYVRPSADVLSLLSGDPVGSSRGTIAATASAQVLFALVPDQDPDTISEQIRAWVTDAMPDYVDYDLTLSETTNQPPYATPPDHPALAVLSDAMSEAWGRPAARMRNAGAAPATLLVDHVGAPQVFFGTGLPNDRWHSSDESVHLGVLFNGAVTMGLFWARLGEAL